MLPILFQFVFELFSCSLNKEVDHMFYTIYLVPSQPPEGVHAYAITSQAINVAWKAPSLFALHGVLQGYKVLFKPVRKDEGKTLNDYIPLRKQIVGENSFSDLI